MTACPAPLRRHDTVLLAHGGGGLLMREMIEELLIPAFDSTELHARHDGATLEAPGARLAFTTDSYVVHPLFFPGGDIGSLAVNGTVNDLAMCGARPLWLSCGLIVEEGLPMETLARVVRSMRLAADAACVRIVTGDTKVVDRGKGDGLFVNTSGVGVIEHGLTIGPGAVRPGDAILVSGEIARHGMAIMATREGLEFESEIRSDCAPLAAPVLALLDAGIEVRCLRDLTRGGLAAGLNEICRDSGFGIRIRESAIPVGESTLAACEILGLDPLYVANEGCFAAFVPGASASEAESILRAHPACAEAAVIGSVEEGPPLVVMESVVGAARIVDLLAGEQLPRIC